MVIELSRICKADGALHIYVNSTPLDKMAAILQIKFSDASLQTKSFVLLLNKVCF